MSWKIEKKTLNGLDTYCIVSGNGAMRHATVEEVDLWTDILKLKAEREELLDFLNKFGFKIEKIIKEKTGKGLQDDKVKVKLDEAKAKTEEKKEKEKVLTVKTDDVKTPPLPGLGAPFGKKEPEISETMAEKFKKKFGYYPKAYKKETK